MGQKIKKSKYKVIEKENDIIPLTRESFKESLKEEFDNPVNITSYSKTDYQNNPFAFQLRIRENKFFGRVILEFYHARKTLCVLVPIFLEEAKSCAQKIADYYETDVYLVKKWRNK